MNEILMECGHTANADCNGKPYCVICDCDKVKAEKPNLDGRTAKCYICGKETKSGFGLPYFAHKENCEHDTYYCGCIGWD